jgi:hypothetical protein
MKKEKEMVKKGLLFFRENEKENRNRKLELKPKITQSQTKDVPSTSCLYKCNVPGTPRFSLSFSLGRIWDISVSAFGYKFCAQSVPSQSMRCTKDVFLTLFRWQINYNKDNVLICVNYFFLFLSLFILTKLRFL